MFINVISADKKNVKNRLMMFSNFLAALLLISDFFAYTFSGRSGKLSYIIVRSSNFALFFFTALILFAYVLYVGYQLFGGAGITTNVEGKIPLRIAFAILTLDIIMIVVTQFTGGMFSIDENNTYSRGPLYYVAALISAATIGLVLYLLIKYRKNVDRIKFLSLISYIFIPGIAMVLQTVFFGFSFINIAIGFSLLLMFIENSVSQSRELINISKLEVRTGLLNEHGCIERLNIMRDKGIHTDYAAVFFDIAKFSDINRKYGMKAGDKVLKNYSEAVKNSLKDKEFLGRQGSDHFIAVVRKDDLGALLDILSGIPIEFTYGFMEEKVTTATISSVAGVYEIIDKKINGEDILANAYTALLYAKTVSNKTVDYMTQELREKIDNDRMFGSQLIDGIEKGEFEAFYQPKVNLDTNELCGAEALARWIHDGEIIPPGKFIPIMEKNDSVCALDFYILSNVCKDMSEWMKEGLDIPVISVNISRRNLSNHNLAEDIDKIVESYGVPKELIEIEITETNDEFPISVLKDFVNSLHKLGYKVAVDDFGCGAASLSLLRETDFDTLKIDKSFIDNAFDKDLAILTHIINMAKAIDMKIIAEGVESKWQEETLQELGVEVVQGYFFDKAVPKDEMVKRINQKEYTRKQ